jgi:hypothetical protein
MLCRMSGSLGRILLGYGFVYREIIAVCSQIHTKHINTLCGQNVELLNVKLALHIVTTGLYDCHSFALQKAMFTLHNSPQHRRIPLPPFSSGPVRLSTVSFVSLAVPRGISAMLPLFAQPQPPVPKITFRKRGCVEQRRHTRSDLTNSSCPTAICAFVMSRHSGNCMYH